ncbi:SPOR domain-containing protein [Solimonas soli]|uniref:SPOR domain-containing protein n=1 Tax=Solimonas soli TaxID=413479 RepID=UPI000485374D|nr:SPOR domain-containing protein [Solimonas soli]
MARDYAQRSSGNRRQTRSTGKRGGGGVPGWIWLIAGLSFGLAVAAFVYIKRPVDNSHLVPQAHEADGEAAAGTAGDDARPAPRKGGKPQALALPPKEKERFTFYEILKNQEVVLPNEAVKSAQPPATPKPQAPPNADGTPPPSPAANADANSGSYIIQVASYRSQAEAEKQKASLALIGVEARIESVTIDNKDTFYRVRIGPDKNWQHVQQTMARLESNGIQALLVKLQ